MLDVAIDYAKRGWGVFPCKNKIPLTAHGYKDASKDPETIRLMFSQFKGCNIAVATGQASGIFVLDIDVKNGSKGKESLSDLEREFGELPHTVEALTWSKGRHIFFKYPEGGIGCKAGVRSGIDIRGDGGYIVVAPSIIEGKAYAWEAAHHPDEVAIAEAPEWLLELLAQDNPAIDLSDNGAKITEHRNTTLMNIAVRLRKMGLEQPEIEYSLLSINERRCIPPLPKKEVLHIAESISKYTIGALCEKEPFTDVWNANIFLEKYGDILKYCDCLGGWFIWDGTRWVKDETFRIFNLAENTVKQIAQMAKVNNDKELLRHAARSESEQKLNAMVNLLRSKEGVAIHSWRFDRDIYLLNCKNGTLDLQTGELKPHAKEDFITRKIDLDYLPKAECLQWRKFLTSIFQGNSELIDFMQKAIGYSLSGSTKEQCIFILFGTGSNGKSTFLKHIFRILGGYALNTPASTLMEKYSDTIPNDIARLKGIRFVTALESSKTRALAESRIKQLTGDDPVSARFLHHEFFDFFATFKIFFATNQKPIIAGTDKGIWRRIRTIPFEKVIEISEVDKELDEKLAKEYPGIFAWAVEGFKKWQEEGLGEAAKITDATIEYQQDSDIIGNYLEERCVVGENYKVQSSTIVKDMQSWARDNGIRYISRNEFIEYMRRKGFVKKSLTAGEKRGNIFWFGVGLKDEESGLSEERPF